MINITFLLLACKLFHVIFLWFAFYVAEKAALDAFITRVYVEKRRPPRLEWIPVGVFSAGAVMVMFLILGSYTVLVRSLTAPLMGGYKLIWTLATDLIVAWALAFVASLASAMVSQNQTCMRYKDDGLRGIRAYCYMALCISVVISLIPYYLIL